MIQLPGIIGKCGDLDVFLSFAPSKLLSSTSVADILDEVTGEGYQRPYSKLHSLDFRRYITHPRSSTIPLVFNLRREFEANWNLKYLRGSRAILYLRQDAQCFARVDGQHRLGELGDLNVPLAFMTFIGLDLRSEMALFSIINSKARGLSSSLTDYLQSSLISDISQEAPHLLLARKLNDDPHSPWHRLVRCGGKATSGPKRRVSLRMMQKSIERFLKRAGGNGVRTVDELYLVVRSFWLAVKRLFPEEWEDPRHHLLNKGIGLYSLMLLLSDLVKRPGGQGLTEDDFLGALLPLKGKIDWHSKGMFSGAGGQEGALRVYESLKRTISQCASY